LTILADLNQLKTRREVYDNTLLRAIYEPTPPAIPLGEVFIPEIAVPLPAMAKFDDFNDRQDQIDAENAPYHQYEYQTEENESWAGALPVKQYVTCGPRVELC
jgi:hypothetical protein